MFAGQFSATRGNDLLRSAIGWSVRSVFRSKLSDLVQ
ncbi:hypothetical protein ACVI1L_005083 [Bradyrhizobium sp. USDA 4516]|nr:hypothetical protein [Bradyrhizobium sp. USDA 4541]